MTKKVKLGLASLGFLGANVAIWPALRNNFASFNIFKNLGWGGGQSVISKVKREVGKDNQNLYFDSLNSKNKTQTDISSKTTKWQETQLDLTKPTNSPILTEKVSLVEKSQEDVSSNIKNISSEIHKENQVNDVEREANSDYIEQIKKYFGANSEKHPNILTHFSSAKQKMEKWKRIKDMISRSQLKSNDDTPDFTQNERKSLKTMYELYDSLKKVKGQKITELTQIKENSEPNSSDSETEGSTRIWWTISKALQWIKWEERVVRVIRSPSQYREHFDANSWGPWKNNPFSNFYESEEIYKKDFQFLNQLRNQIYDARRRHNHQMHFAFQHRERGRDNAIKQIKDLRDSNWTYRHVEARVAEKLLREMNQFD